ncbi:MAG: squalene/phytoene synthase family protein [Mariniphaga sp.]
MDSVNLYDQVSFKVSKLVTRTYSTSFSIAVSFLDLKIQNAIYSIYGFVRCADEIVDTFLGHDKEMLLDKFEADYYEALNCGISLNLVLHSFQLTVKRYQIPDELIKAFLFSMRSDIHKSTYNSKSEINQYIYGSADVVGLMCLAVFTDGNSEMYESLKEPAMRLGSAFQKVNFLRDLRSDTEYLDRQYFPEMGNCVFNDQIKAEIISDIEKDFLSARKGISDLPQNAQLAVLIAFYYYLRLVKKVKYTPATKILTARIRVSGTMKMALLAKAFIVHKLGLI